MVAVGRSYDDILNVPQCKVLVCNNMVAVGRIPYNLLCPLMGQGTKQRSSRLSYTLACLYSNMVVYDKIVSVVLRTRLSHAVIVQKHGDALRLSNNQNICCALRCDSALRKEVQDFRVHPIVQQHT